MFRTLCFKSIFTPRTVKRIMLAAFSLLLIWLCGAALTIYLKGHHVTILAVENATLSIPAALTMETEDGSTNAFSYKEYENPAEELFFRYPQSFYLKEISLAGTEIPYHLDIRSKNGPIHGYLQIWQLEGTLRGFLNRAMDYKSADIGNFQESTLLIQETPGYLWQYEVQGTDGTTVARQAFLEHKGHMYVLSLFVAKDRYTEEFDTIFQTMLYSIRFH